MVCRVRTLKIIKNLLYKIKKHTNNAHLVLMAMLE